MINWKYPKRGELPEVGREIVEALSLEDGRDIDVWTPNTPELVQAIVSPWCYLNDFPWPEDLEDEKSEKMR